MAWNYYFVIISRHCKASRYLVYNARPLSGLERLLLLFLFILSYWYFQSCVRQLVACRMCCLMVGRCSYRDDDVARSGRVAVLQLAQLPVIVGGMFGRPRTASPTRTCCRTHSIFKLLLYDAGSRSKVSMSFWRLSKSQR